MITKQNTCIPCVVFECDDMLGRQGLLGNLFDYLFVKAAGFYQFWGFRDHDP